MLSTLPNELVLAVAQRLCSDKDICALARTDRRLHRLLEWHLYVHNAEHGGSALFWAAEHCQTRTTGKAIEARLHTRVDVDSRDRDGRTALWWAAWYGHKGVVKQLLDTGNVDVDSKDICGRTPLSCAASRGHEGVVSQLLGTGNVDADCKDGDNRSPLWWAADGGHEGMVRQLLETGKVDADSKDGDGEVSP